MDYSNGSRTLKAFIRANKFTAPDQIRAVKLDNLPPLANKSKPPE